MTKDDIKTIRLSTSRRWPAAIAALLSEASVELAANQVKVSKRTMLRWMQDPEFRAALARAKADVLKVASTILVRNVSRAALVLEKIFSGRPTPHQSARVAAARSTIELALQGFELELLEERVRKLEEQSSTDDGDSYGKKQPT